MKKLIRKFSAFTIILTIALSTISTIQNVGATVVTAQAMVEILEWSYEIGSFGDIYVHAIVRNNSPAGAHEGSGFAGFMAIGRNSNDEIVEVAANIRDIIPGNTGGAFLSLDAGSQITNVSVYPVIEYRAIDSTVSGSIDLLASGYRHENGHVAVTGVWQNNTRSTIDTTYSHAIFLALGRNENGEVVSVGGRYFMIYPTSIISPFGGVWLPGGSQITDVSIVTIPVEESLTGIGSVDILAHGHHYERGHVIVTGVLQDNTDTATYNPDTGAVTGPYNPDTGAATYRGAYMNMMATGYDANGKSVEVISSSSHLLLGVEVTSGIE